MKTLRTRSLNPASWQSGRPPPENRTEPRDRENRAKETDALPYVKSASTVDLAIGLARGGTAIRQINVLRRNHGALKLGRSKGQGFKSSLNRRSSSSVIVMFCRAARTLNCCRTCKGTLKLRHTHCVLREVVGERFAKLAFRSLALVDKSLMSSRPIRIHGASFWNGEPHANGR